MVFQVATTFCQCNIKGMTKMESFYDPIKSGLNWAKVRGKSMISREGHRRVFAQDFLVKVKSRQATYMTK